MKTNLKTIDGLTEKGIVKGAVRDSLKKQVENNFFPDWNVENDGSLSYDLVKDKSGKMIKVRIRMTITAQEEFALRGSKKEEVKTVVPTLF